MTDLDIAQSVTPRPILDIGSQLGIRAEELTWDMTLVPTAVMTQLAQHKIVMPAVANTIIPSDDALADRLDRERRQPLGEADALLERLPDLLVVQRVGRAVEQALAVGDGHPAPALQQFDDARLRAERSPRSASAT